MNQTDVDLFNALKTLIFHVVSNGDYSDEKKINKYIDVIVKIIRIMIKEGKEE